MARDERVWSVDEMRRQPRAGAKQASMADVALAAGVSMMTVSRMMREPGRVAEATRQRIEAAMADVGYVPNLVAGGLAATRTQLVAAIVPYIQHGVFADAVQGFSDRLTARGYCVLLGNSGGSVDEEETIVRALLGHRPAGLVIQGANHTERTRLLLSRASIPVVEMGTLPDAPLDMCVGYSNEEAAKVVVRHLVSLGRRRIAFIGYPAGANDRHQQRFEGYRKEIASSGLAFEPALVAEAEFSIAAGRAAFNAILDRVPDVDGIFCSSDLWAAAAVFECQRRGIAVPDAIAVAGFNDQEIASEMNPPLTTIRVRRQEIGAMAADMILARIGDEEVPDARVDVGFELIVRASAPSPAL